MGVREDVRACVDVGVDVCLRIQESLPMWWW